MPSPDPSPEPANHGSESFVFECYLCRGTFESEGSLEEGEARSRQFWGELMLSGPTKMTCDSCHRKVVAFLRRKAELQ
jgi:hypothetical protein